MVLNVTQFSQDITKFIFLVLKENGFKPRITSKGVALHPNETKKFSRKIGFRIKAKQARLKIK